MAGLTYTDFFKVPTELVKGLADSAKKLHSNQFCCARSSIAVLTGFAGRGRRKIGPLGLGTPWSLVAAGAFLSGSHCVRSRLKQATQPRYRAEPLEIGHSDDDLVGAGGAENGHHQVERLGLDLLRLHRVARSTTHRIGAVAERPPIGGLAPVHSPTRRQRGLYL